MKKLLIYLKVHLSKIILILALVFFFTVISTLLFYGFANFFTLENFSRRMMMANLGIYIVVGMIQAVMFVTFLQIGQYYFMSGAFLGRLGSEKATRAKADVKWADVIGMESAKKEAWELVELLKDRAMVKAIGGKIIKGTMMIGPPGCGKTYLAKAIAAECGMPLLSVVGSDFVGILVGQGAMQMKALFKEARGFAELHGGCIIFIDEIDSFARPRQQISGFGGSISHNATINQFLTEMDGLRQAENNIVVIAATNVPEGELDEAIMRSGRFDRKIYVTKPNLKERVELFKFYLSKVKIDETVDNELLARKTLWFSPADISNMVREASLICIRDKRDKISVKDLSKGYDRVVFGEKSNIILPEKDKIWVAYHEAGHAIIQYLIHPTDDIIKATIIPRKGALGFVAPSPREEYYIRSRDWYLSEIKVFLASYAAERIKFGTTGSGVSNDFNRAMYYAYSMVYCWGMGKSGYLGDIEEQNYYHGGFVTNNISDKTKEQLDNDIQDILKTCLKEVDGILNDKKELLDYFAQELLKKEELEYDEIVPIFDKFGLKPAVRS